MNIIGKYFRVISIGESHGKIVGVVIDGCPSGLRFDLEKMQVDLNRRRPGQSQLTTSRNELDIAEVLTGLYKGITTGAPITIIIRNQDRDSTKYLKTRWTPRPGHADYTAGLRYGEYQDPRGGGRFSGRNTAGFVMAGSVAKQILAKIGTKIIAYTHQIGGIVTPDLSSFKQIEDNPVRCPDPDAAGKMIKEIEKVKEGCKEEFYYKGNPNTICNKKHICPICYIRIEGMIKADVKVQEVWDELIKDIENKSKKFNHEWQRFCIDRINKRFSGKEDK